MRLPPDGAQTTRGTINGQVLWRIFKYVYAKDCIQNMYLKNVGNTRTQKMFFIYIPKLFPQV